MIENIAQIKSGITINVNVTVRTSKNPATCTCDNSEYLANITDNYSNKGNPNKNRFKKL